MTVELGAGGGSWQADWLSVEAEKLYETHQSNAAHLNEKTDVLTETVESVTNGMANVMDWQSLADLQAGAADLKDRDRRLADLRYQFAGEIGDMLIASVIDVAIAKKAYKDNIAAAATHFSNNRVAYWRLALEMDAEYVKNNANDTLGN